MLERLLEALAEVGNTLWSWVLATPPPLAEFLAQATATLVGALVAFRLEARRQDHLLVSGRARDARRALYVLLAHRTFLLNLEKQELRPLGANAHRAFVMKPIPLVPPQLGVDLAALAFLLETPHADLLNQLEVASRDYSTVIAILRARNGMHGRFQDRLEEKTVTVPLNGIALEQVPELVGPTIRNNLIDMTDQLYEMTSRAIESNRKIYGALDAALREVFPHEQFFTSEELGARGVDGAV